MSHPLRLVQKTSRPQDTENKPSDSAYPDEYKPFRYKDDRIRDSVPLPIDGWQAVYDHLVAPKDGFSTSGDVHFEFIVEKDGSVGIVTIISGLSDQIDNAVAQTVRTMDFVPARKKDGKAVGVRCAYMLLLQKALLNHLLNPFRNRHSEMNSLG